MMRTFFLHFVAWLLLPWPGFVWPQSPDRVSTPEDRAALFDYLLQKTMEREAFSPLKNEMLRIDVEKEMFRFRQELIGANTDETLFYTLIKISNARKDRHLRVSLVDGGLEVLQVPTRHAPIRFAVDYSEPENFFVFVADFARNISDFLASQGVNVGDRLLSVNGRPIDSYLTTLEPYIRYSTTNGLWWKFAEELPVKQYRMPKELYRDNVTYELETEAGVRYKIDLPFLKPESIHWQGFWKSHGDHRYPGFSLVYSTQTYDVYQAESGKKVLLLDWYGFRENLVPDVDRLMDFATKNDLLDHAIIWDGTGSRGGSKGAYAIQRFSSRPFKTTFGNLRLSDTTKPFVARKRLEFDRRSLNDSGVSETVGSGRCLLDWLEDDVLQGLRAGQAYSNNVPFKLAHLPKYSDGVVQPAPTHFRGPMVCLLSPHGGSHLDQFAAIVIDNELAHTIGMPAGGYSNTWEWRETLTFPISRKPVVEYMWSIGHTIRPNGEILEGNPAPVHDYVPLTRENYLAYYELLLSRALKHLGLE